jgi:glutamine amidotransferase
VAVVDYGVSNLRSVERALGAVGAEPVLTRDPETIDGCAGVVLPGVGAFGAAVDALDATGMRAAVIAAVDRGLPLLGVCLGFQLLFEWSDESGGRPGLGLLGGRITRIPPCRGKVPHMGWNRLRLSRPSPLLEGVADGTWAYFVHSYAAPAEGDDVVASCDYGGADLAAACARSGVYGTQFHPEKSGPQGLRLYANFVGICEGGSRGESPRRMGASAPEQGGSRGESPRRMGASAPEDDEGGRSEVEPVPRQQVPS